MGKITFILGGARSGKSSQAVKLAVDSGGKAAFIATCEPLDEEMQKRIRLHKKSRPANWKSFDSPKLDTAALKDACARFDVVIIDCLTLLVSNLMLCGLKEAAIKKKIASALKILARSKAAGIIVSNEVGLGIVPDTKLGRDFRDVAGRINQMAARKSGEVIFMVSGIPWRIK